MDYVKLQEDLAEKVICDNQLDTVEYLAGVDVAYQQEGDLVVAAITILDALSLELVEVSTHYEKVSFPYIPGLFSFRELPPVLKAYSKLKIKPDIIICDGQGYAHPRRFGLACHMGVELDVPTIGCAKTRFVGEYNDFDLDRGNSSSLVYEGETVGKVLCTQDNTKPVFVSIGHKIDLVTACDWVLKATPKYRLPETTRTADHTVNMLRKAL
ncbi:MAG: deoxyribonuclease V [Hyphomicrobiales bacterium]